MAGKSELTPEKAIKIVQRIRAANSRSAKVYRQTMLARGYRYLQVWVPGAVYDDARRAADAVVRRYERQIALEKLEKGGK